MTNLEVSAIRYVERERNVAMAIHQKPSFFSLSSEAF